MGILKIGDRVQIRPKLKGGNYYGDMYFSSGMLSYRNRVATITEDQGDERYKIDIAPGYIWSIKMFTEDSIRIASEKRKLKIGDRVIADDKVDLPKARGEEGTIIRETSSERYLVEFDEFVDGHSGDGLGKDGHCWNIDSKHLEKINATTETTTGEYSSEDMKTLAESINKLAKEIRKEDPFKQAMIEGIIEKGKQLATEDLKKEIKEDLDKFIHETYGNIPKKIKIERDTKTKEIEGIFHKDFEKICKIVDSNIPLMLVGGAGAGKNYTLEQVAQALDLTFYTTNAVNQDYKLTGFIDANGKYHETEFYKAFVNGGMFFLDEIDASCPEALVTLNSAIANKYFDFPIGRVTAHKDFRVVCAGNTYGTGADMVYVGRNVLDGATLDRFVVLEFDYDDEVEKQLAYDDELYKFIKDLRNAVSKAGLRYIVSMRALINSTKLLGIGIDKSTILKTTVIKNMQKDDLNTVIEKLEITSSDWYRELKRLCD